jgi:Na+/citrate or Na+/malate symporter
MTGKHFSIAALLVALGQLLVAIGTKNPAALYASITAILACFLPSLLTWLTPPAAEPKGKAPHPPIPREVEL